MNGCLKSILVLVGLVLVLFVGGVGFLGYHGNKLANEMGAGIEEIRATDADHPFEPPTDGRLDEQRMSVFLAVRAGSVAGMQRTLADLEDVGSREPTGFFDGIRMAVGAAKGLMAAFKDVPRQMAVQLREHGMGISEYLWTAELVHGTLAGADRAGDKRATAVVDELESQFDDEGEEGHVRFDDRNVDYRALRHDLERKYADFDPENLELILKHSDQIREPPSQVMLDVFLLRQLPNGPEKPTEEDPAPPR